MDLAGEQVQPKMYQKPTIEKDTAKNEILIKPKKKDKPSKAVSSKGTTTSSELNKSSVLGSSRQKKVTKSSLPLTSESGTYFYNIK
jgi:hypothetical protein